MLKSESAKAETDVGSALLVGGGGFQGLPVLRALHALGWRVVVADSVFDSLNRFEADAFHLMPEVRHASAFRTELTSLIERHAAKAVFPTTMYDLPALAALRPELEQRGVRVFASSATLVALLSDKREAMQAMAQAGLPVLPEIDPERHDFAFPLIGKPVRGWGGLGILKAASRPVWQDLDRRGVAQDILWQRELGEFCEWSVDFALRADGVCSPLVCRRRLRASGGFAILSEVVAPAPVEAFALQAAAWLAQAGGLGLFNIQFLQERGGAIWLSDVNPRPGTSSGAALSAGVNLVEFLLDQGVECHRPQAGIAVRSLRDRFLPRLECPVRAVVFDLDETLICQKSWMQSKLQIVLRGLEGLWAPTNLTRFQAEALRVIDEGPWPQLIDVALNRSGLPGTDAARLIGLWRQASPPAIKLHQDAWALARALQVRGIPLALLSDNPAASQRQKIALLPSDVQFRSVVLTDELAAPKPDVRGFLAAAEGLGLAPESLLMVGDSPWRDALGALHAGYAGALVIQRQASMSNPMRELFDSVHGEVARERVVWTDSLFGIEHVLEVP